MGILERVIGWGEWIRDGKDAEHKIYLPSVETEDELSTLKVQSGEGYFSATIAEMHLSHSRQWWHEIRPVTLCETRFQVSQGKREPDKSQSIPFVIGPTTINSKANNLVMSDLPATDRIPYRGGAVTLGFGLAAIRTSSYLDEAMDFVDRMSSIVVESPAVTSMVDLARNVADGAEKLLPADGDEMIPILGLDIGLHEPISAGYRLVINAPVGSIEDAQEMRVINGQVFDKSGNRLTGVDYMLIRIDTYKSKNWRRLGLERSIDPAVRLAAAGNSQGAEVLLHGAFGVLSESPELTKADKIRARDELLAEFRQRTAPLDLGLEMAADGEVLAPMFD